MTASDSRAICAFASSKLHIAPGLPDPLLRGRPRRQRALLGDLTHPDDGREIHRRGGRGLGDGGLTTDQRCNQISYFIDAVKNVFARRRRDAAGEDSLLLMGSLLQDQPDPSTVV